MHLVHTFESAHLYSSSLHKYCILLLNPTLGEVSHSFDPMPSFSFTSSTCHVGALPTEGAAAFKLILIYKILPLLNHVSICPSSVEFLICFDVISQAEQTKRCKLLYIIAYSFCM